MQKDQFIDEKVNFVSFFHPVPNFRSYCKHTHKKQKDSLKKRAVLLILLLEREISVVVVQRIHGNSKHGCEQLLSENDFVAVPTLPRQLRRSLQVKQIITNAPRVLDC